MSEIIDLDLIEPPITRVKINGKIIECKPIKVKQLIRLLKAEQEIAKIGDVDKASSLLIEALTPLIPAIDDPDVDFSFEQLKTLTTILQTKSVPDHLKRVSEEYNPKKKSDGDTDSDSSLDTTQDTQSTPS